MRTGWPPIGHAAQPSRGQRIDRGLASLRAKQIVLPSGLNFGAGDVPAVRRQAASARRRATGTCHRDARTMARAAASAVVGGDKHDRLAVWRPTPRSAHRRCSPAAPPASTRGKQRPRLAIAADIDDPQLGLRFVDPPSKLRIGNVS